MQSNHYIGINVGHHNSSVCLLKTGSELTVTVYEEERFSRKKNKGFFPYTAIQRLALENDLSQIPASQHCASNYIESLRASYDGFEKRSIHFEFVQKYRCENLTMFNPHLLQITHHEAHLFSILPAIKDDETLIIVADGCGSPASYVREKNIFGVTDSLAPEGFENVTVFLKQGKSISCVKRELTPHRFAPNRSNAISDIYNQAAYHLFGSWHYCGKVMGLAAYNDQPLLSIDELVSSLSTELPNEQLGQESFDQLPESSFVRFAQIAASTQHHFESYFMTLFAELKKCYPCISTVAFVGGSALNCVFNSKTYSTGPFQTIITSAFPNDEGISVGAAIAGAYQQGHYVIDEHHLANSPFLGSGQSLSSSASLGEIFHGHVVRAFNDNYFEVASEIARGTILPWAHGRSECGPRALCHRSIFASPFVAGIKNTLNSEIKRREAFRPYGISILKEDVATYFEVRNDFTSPYMSFSPVLRMEFRTLFREILHPDNSIRVQTVDESMPELQRLLQAFKAVTGHGALIHTSLNVMGEPIVEDLADLERFFSESKLTKIFVGGFLISKELP